MDFSAGTIIASFAVSTVGFGFFLYGKKETRMPQLVVGVLMMAFPCLGTGPVTTWGIGGALVLALALAVRAGM